MAKESTLLSEPGSAWDRLRRYGPADLRALKEELVKLEAKVSARLDAPEPDALNVLCDALDVDRQYDASIRLLDDQVAWFNAHMQLGAIDDLIRFHLRPDFEGGTPPEWSALEPDTRDGMKGLDLPAERIVFWLTAKQQADIANWNKWHSEFKVRQAAGEMAQEIIEHIAVRDEKTVKTVERAVYRKPHDGEGLPHNK